MFSISKERSQPKIFTSRGMKDGQMKFENFLFDSMLKLHFFSRFFLTNSTSKLNFLPKMTVTLLLLHAPGNYFFRDQYTTKGSRDQSNHLLLVPLGSPRSLIQAVVRWSLKSDGGMSTWSKGRLRWRPIGRGRGVFPRL
jgi:hypothetical protein